MRVTRSVIVLAGLTLASLTMTAQQPVSPGCRTFLVSIGKPLWHVGLGTNTTNGPQTYILDGRQNVVVGAGDTFFVFALQL